MHFDDIHAVRASMADAAAELPEDRQALMACAKRYLLHCNDAIEAGCEAEALSAYIRYSAVAWKLNGGTHFAVDAPNGAGPAIREYCQASPGAGFAWYQKGAYVTELRGVPILVESPGYTVGLRQCIHLHVVDLERPFVSNTGYRSLIMMPTQGRTVKEAVRLQLEELASDGMPMVEAERYYKHSLPDWLASDLDKLVSRTHYQETDGQFAMVF